MSGSGISFADAGSSALGFRTCGFMGVGCWVVVLGFVIWNSEVQSSSFQASISECLFPIRGLGIADVLMLDFEFPDLSPQFC